jgi:hypothetical protein
MDSIDNILCCLHFVAPDQKIIPAVETTPTSYQKMWEKLNAFSDEEIKGIWDSMQYCLRKRYDAHGNLLFDRKAYWDLEKTITLEEWEEAVYSQMGLRRILA